MKTIAALAVILGVVLTASACTQGKDPNLPEPYIKFEGNQVKFAENIPDCH